MVKFNFRVTPTLTGIDVQELILQELQKANSRLDEFGINLQSIESRLSSVEEYHESTITASSPSGNEETCGKSKRTVPPKVLVC